MMGTSAHMKVMLINNSVVIRFEIFTDLGPSGNGPMLDHLSGSEGGSSLS